MTVQSTLTYLDALYQNVDPSTGECLPPDSVFRRQKVRYALANLRTTLRHATDGEHPFELTDEALQFLCQQLQDLRYEVNTTQLLHICRGSRRVVDPNLKGLEAFGRYRGLHSKTEIERRLRQFAQRHPECLSPQQGQIPANHQATSEAWKKEPFFDETPFDKLEAEKSLELQRDIWALGLKKELAELPEFKQRARQRYPRAYEPWTRAEKAILLEAMCYSNQVESLAPIFGRGMNAVKRMGQRLVWESRQKCK